MFRVRSLLLRPRTKIAILVLAWVVWWMVAAGGIQVLSVVSVAQAQDFSDMGAAQGITDTTGTQGLQQPTPTTPVSGASGAGFAGEQTPALTPEESVADGCDEACQRRIWQQRTTAPPVNTITDPANQVDGPGVRTVTPDPTFGGAIDEQMGAGIRGQGLPTPPQFLTEEQARQLNAQSGTGGAAGNGGVGGTGGQAGNGGVGGTGGAAGNGGVGGGGAGTGVSLRNPLAGISTIPDLLAAILNVVIIIAIPIIIFFLMLAGFKYVTARGNPSTISEASQALLYAIIGGVLILGATAIAQIIKNLVNAFRS